MRWYLMLSIWLSGCSAVKTHRVWLGRKAQKQGFEKSTLNSGPHQISHWVAGDGPTVLLIHGFGGNGLFTWWSQAKVLAETHRVIIPDLLWFGDSSSSAEPSLDAQAQAIDELVRHLVPRGQKVHVAGISYGGLVALRYGSLAPTQQAKLIMVDSPGPLFTAQDEQAMLQRYEAEQTEDLFVPTSIESVRTLVRLAYHKPPPLPKFLLKDLKANVFAQHQAEQRALLADLKSNRSHYKKNQPASYDDVLVIWGEYDRVFPLDIGKQLAEHMGAELFVIENTGHAPILEKPHAINKKLRSFLQP